MRMQSTLKSKLLIAATVIFGASACAPLATSGVQYQPRNASGDFAALDSEEGLREVTITGTQFESQEEQEGRLLYKAASLTKQNGFDWFALRHLPGEGGPDVHPPRRAPSFGANYGHWQPHWTYYVTGLGWQPWRPEWGVRFWAADIDLKAVERFEVHAMIKMGHRSSPSTAGLNFDASRILQDLGPRFGQGRS